MLTIQPDEDTPAGPYTRGDRPGPISAAILADDGSDLDLSAVWIVTGTVTAPAGTSQPLSGVAVSETTDRVTWEWPVSSFVAAGLHSVIIRGVGDTELSSAFRTTEPLPVVVEDSAGWLTIALARRLWPDAPPDDVALFLILESARIACESYAPELPEATRPPSNYIQAQLGQARSVWNLMQTSPQADVIGFDQTGIRVYPLDYNIRQLLRPKSGIPGMW